MFKNNLLKDKPISNSKDDVLGYDEFAQSIVNLLHIVPDDESFNFALCGEWGSGKTSIINLVESYVAKDNLYSIIHFNPWNITKKENLFFEYLELLRSAIYKETGDKRLSIAIDNYSKILIDTIGNDSLFTNFLKNLLRIITLSFYSNKKTVSDQKEYLCSYLSEKYIGKPFLVIIDDLDRLTNPEVCEVLKLIREIADFPHIVYFVAFDKAQIEKAIQEELKPSSAHEYLKKFFQLEWGVPEIKKKQLKKYLLIKLRNLENLKEKVDNNEQYFNDLFDKCISVYVTNIRDVIILINSFYQRHSLLNNWVNFVDLLTITSFELFCPALFKFIKENKELLLFGRELPGYDPLERYMSKTSESDIAEEKKKYIKERLLCYFDNIELEPVLRALFALFPQFAKNCDQYVRFSDDAVKARRICSSICFDSYFTLRKNDINLLEMGMIHKVVYDFSESDIRNFFSNKMKNASLLENIFTEFSQELISQNDENRLFVILKELFFVGSSIVGKKKVKTLFRENLRKMPLEIVFQILNKLSQSKNNDFLRRAIFEGDSFLNVYKFAVYFMNMIRHNYKNRQEPEPEGLFLTFADYDKLVLDLKNELNKNAENIELFDAEYENEVFIFYVQNSPESLDQHYLKVLKRTENLISLCVIAYPSMILENYKTISDLFNAVYPNIMTIQNRESEIANYVNDGNYNNLPNDQLLKFARFVDKMNVEQFQTSDKNVDNWKNIKEIAEKHFSD